MSNSQKQKGYKKPELWKPDWVKVSMTNDENTSGGAFFDIPYKSLSDGIGGKKPPRKKVKARMLTMITILVLTS